MLPRFQHLLVPVDFTEKNLRALDIAFEVAVLSSARVTLLHVIETIDFAPDRDVREFYDMLEAHAETELESISQRFLEAHVATDRTIRFGKRAHEVVKYAIEHGIDLVVMSSHRVDPQNLIKSSGTLSYQVSILCPCDVLLVK